MAGVDLFCEPGCAAHTGKAAATAQEGGPSRHGRQHAANGNQELAQVHVFQSCGDGRVGQFFISGVVGAQEEAADGLLQQ